MPRWRALLVVGALAAGACGSGSVNGGGDSSLDGGGGGTGDGGGGSDGRIVDDGGGGDAGDRSNLVPGTYRPGPDTTGPLPGVELTVHEGDYTVLEAGAIVEALDIHGRLVLGPDATDVAVRNCILRGPGSDVTVGGSALSGGGPNLDRLGLVIEDSRIDFTGRESWWLDGLQGSHLTIRRTEITRTVDGVGMVAPGGHVTVEASWIHDDAYFTWDADTPDPHPSHASMDTHNDGVQFHRGTEIVLRGNSIGGADGEIHGTGESYSTSAILISQGVDAQPGNQLGVVLIEQNWLGGGAATINLTSNLAEPIAEVTIRDNRFDRDDHGYYIRREANFEAVLTGNVFDDDDGPVPIYVAPE